MQRTLVAVALAISATALAIGLTSLVLVLRDDDDGPPGRVIAIAGVSAMAINKPVLYEKDDFYLVRLPDYEGSVRQVVALYQVVPHQYFGYLQGCRVKWEPDQSEESNGSTYTGIFYEGCGGAKFAVDGKRLFGPSPGGLSRFYANGTAGNDTAQIDTRLLTCDTNVSPCQRTLAGE